MLRKRYRFRGTVQGVGFRPAISRIASGLGLDGFVQNRSSEVVAEVRGTEEAISRFEAALQTGLPPAARLERIQAEVVESPAETSEALAESDGFLILESEPDLYSFPPIPPDLPLCPECAAELLDPGNRRYLYPFITCTQCGPRYSIVERTPFDRRNTSMRPFEPCPACAREYRDPVDRRFHSQTNSCPTCGPRLTLLDGAGRRLTTDPIPAAMDLLADGGIVAVEGIGGFHLAAVPAQEGAVQRLRRDKERERKPFALMVQDLAEATKICRLSPAEVEALSSSQAPIVIAARAPDAPDWLRAVSDTDTLGIMLPYTPLHLLLFRHPDRPPRYRCLVMTSGNRAREPIITDPADAVGKLLGVADAFLVHDRRIVLRTDDSIVRVG
ncbi:MAG TPA: Sua5/YciO/YrdC/YwlC family protein, partial [Spirochaetia bacterium]|nr:Sua5/YciO/YrdC/YwlC family protein [Spirochaetia bacterium]